MSAASAFADELRLWGPDRPTSAAVSLEEARTYCRRLAQSHYENFPVASWLLPRKLHQPFYNVYAYCRWADDLGDEVGDADESLRLLAWWGQQLRDCYAGQATHPVFIALAETIRDFQIPIQPFADLISAFEQDQQVHEYDTFEQLLDYCRRSANPVGRLVLYLCRRPEERHFQWSDSICTGLQLANFWQDVGRDLEIGRVYLPREDCERFGYTREALRQRVTNDPFLQLMRFQVDRARTFLKPWRQQGAVMPGMPFRLQVEIELFARGGLKILDRIEGIGYRVWDTRPKLTKWDFVSLLAGCIWRALARRTFRRKIPAAAPGATSAGSAASPRHSS